MSAALGLVVSVYIILLLESLFGGSPLEPVEVVQATL